MKIIIFIILWLVGVGIINALNTTSQETYIKTVGLIETPTMLENWLMIGFTYVLYRVFKFRDRSKHPDNANELTIPTQFNSIKFFPSTYEKYIDEKLVAKGQNIRTINLNSISETKVSVSIEFNYHETLHFSKELEFYGSEYYNNDLTTKFIIYFNMGDDSIESLQVIFRKKKERYYFKK